jgi:hypothetical protein
MFLPDNDHLHNRIHLRFKALFKSPTMANSMTGLLIASASSGVALVGYLGSWWPAAGSEWLAVFAAQCMLYALVFIGTAARENGEVGRAS